MESSHKTMSEGEEIAIHASTAGSSVNFRHWSIAAVLVMALMLDGIDVKSLNYMTPLIIAEWGVSKGAFSVVLSAALVGMAIGSWLGGWCGDRWGRKTLIVLSLLVFGSCTVVAAFTTSIATLALVRFVSGLGFGAASPNAYAMASEWMPDRIRSVCVALVTVGSPIGGTLGALMAIWLLPAVGWRGAFILAGALTIVVGVIAVLLPETVGFLLAKGQLEAASRQWARVYPHDGPNFVRVASAQSFSGDVPVRHRSHQRSIFTRELLRINIGAFSGFFAVNFVNYAAGSWGTVILTDAGLSLPSAVSGAFWYSLLAVTFGLGTGQLLKVTGSRAVVIVDAVILCGLLLTLCSLLNSGAEADRRLILGIFGLLGGMAGSLITTMIAIVSAAYPVDVRATGVGFSITTGWIGGTASVLSGGILLSLNHNRPTLLLLTMAILALGIIASALITNRHVLPLISAVP
jgi:MFS transporter, AAHS family, 4-hydroxybenzoate transporter